jgi:hypothetical protein
MSINEEHRRGKQPFHMLDRFALAAVRATPDLQHASRAESAPMKRLEIFAMETREAAARRRPLRYAGSEASASATTHFLAFRQNWLLKAQHPQASGPTSLGVFQPLQHNRTVSGFWHDRICLDSSTPPCLAWVLQLLASILLPRCCFKSITHDDANAKRREGVHAGQGQAT